MLAGVFVCASVQALSVLRTLLAGANLAPPPREPKAPLPLPGASVAFPGASVALPGAFVEVCAK